MESKILALIDQLEALLNAGGRVPLSGRLMVNATEAYRLLDQMRQNLPHEVIRARHIYQERERILHAAQIDAENTRVAAQAERAALLTDHAITIEAIHTAEQVKREARTECERIRLDADAYALHSLRDLQVQLVQTRVALDATLKTIIGGVELLESRSARVIPEKSPLPQS